MVVRDHCLARGDLLADVLGIAVLRSATRSIAGVISPLRARCSWVPSIERIVVLLDYIT